MSTTHPLHGLALGAAFGLGAALPALAQEDADLATRGEYIARAADCAACHTAPDGGAAYAGGYAISSPLGDIYSGNITPSERYGIGNWSEADFARAVRKGVLPDGTHLYPAMPYAAYAGITDDDMKALYAYFMQEVEPVDQPPRQKTELDFPFNQRWAMAGWNLLFAGGEPFTPAEGEDEAHARGRYLVDVLGHCGSCHTRRDWLMGSEGSQYLAGAEVDGWIAPNITSDPLAGIGGWSEDDLTTFLTTGRAAGKGVAAGGMGEVVERSLRHLTNDDARAITAYLKSVPAKSDGGQKRAAFDYGTPVETPYAFTTEAARATLADARSAQDQITDDETTRSSFDAVDDGALLYDAACSSCHQPSGAGTKDNYYPSLYHSTAAGAATGNNLVMTILNGVHRTGSDGTIAMPAFRDQLTNAQVAAVAGYVARRFGNPAMDVTPQKVVLWRNGGEPPLLARIGPWLVWGPVILVLLLVLLIGGLMVSRRRRA